MGKSQVHESNRASLRNRRHVRYTIPKSKGLLMHRTLLVFIAAYLFTNCVAAADFSFRPQKNGSVQVVLSGKIEPGDREKLIDLIRQEPKDFVGASYISLNSPGGSVLDALKIADVVEKSGLIAVVNSGDTCASSCFLVLASAQFRWQSPKAEVLIHRPYLLSQKTDLLGYNQNVKTQQAGVAAMRAFLEERSISASIIDKMMSYPSNAAYQLTPTDMREGVRYLSPTLEELTIAKCGLSNLNIFSPDRNFGGKPDSDDLSCIRHFLIRLKFEFTRVVIGEEKFEKVLNSL